MDPILGLWVVTGWGREACGNNLNRAQRKTLRHRHQLRQRHWLEGPRRGAIWRKIYNWLIPRPFYLLCHHHLHHSATTI